jgi:hypothetical protein
MHLSDTALGAALDPSGGGTAGAAARAHAVGCAGCGRAIQDARTADREVADLLRALDHPLPLISFSAIEEGAARADIASHQAPRFMRGLMRPGNPHRSKQPSRLVVAHGVRGPVVRWVAILVVATAVAAVAAVPRSPVRHLIAALVARDRHSHATVPVAPPPSMSARPAATTPRGVAIIAQGHVVVAFRLPQAGGMIRVTAASTPDLRGARVSVMASGDGATYTVSQDTIAIDNRGAPTLDYDVALPPPSQLPAASIRVAGRVIFARRGATIVTTGVKQPGGAYAIPLSVAGAAVF